MIDLLPFHILQLVKSLPCQIVLFTWNVNVSPRTCTQIHTPTEVQGVGGDGTPPKSFWYVAVFRNDFAFSGRSISFSFHCPTVLCAQHSRRASGWEATKFRLGTALHLPVNASMISESFCFGDYDIVSQRPHFQIFPCSSFQMFFAALVIFLMIVPTITRTVSLEHPQLYVGWKELFWNSIYNNCKFVRHFTLVFLGCFCIVLPAQESHQICCCFF